jgi:DNA processing protein
MSAGCHSLISDGAKLTANIDDILEEIGPLSFVAGQCEPGLILQPGVNERLDEGSKLLLDNIGYEPVTIDQLVTETGLQVNNVSVILLELELLGLVDTLPGGRFTRK